MSQKHNLFNLLFEKNFILFPILLLFFGIKLLDFNLPYFWDEAWSYIPAIKEMATQGPSLLPNSISPDLYRGHPLLFYFLSSSWLRFFGDELGVMRLFSFLISSGLLVSIYFLAKKLFDYKIATIATFTFLIQSVFLAQATFLLPEILLTLFTVLSFHAYFTRKIILLVLWLTLALFTKESGAIIWVTILFSELLQMQKNYSKIGLSKSFYSLISLTIPILFISTFFIIQKTKVGWFFFPEHIHYLSYTSLLGKLESYSSYLFIYMGRNLLTFIGLIALVGISIRKKKSLSTKKEILIPFTFFIISYLLFSSINFYSPRYILSVLPFTTLIFIFLIYEFLKTKKIILTSVLIIILLNNTWFSLNNKQGNDHTLGYRDLIEVQIKAIDYCEKNNFYTKNITTQFLMKHNLTNKNLGYLKNDKSFSNITNTITDSTNYIIICSNEVDKTIYKKQKLGVLIKTFKKDKCWTEIYKVNP